MLTKFRATFSDYPRTFWTLVGASFIDRLGGALIFPFLSLYITKRFQVGLTEVGLLLGIWSISGLAGSMVGGAMTDKFGRRFMLIFGLIFSAGTALLMGFANDLNTFFWVLAFSGFLSVPCIFPSRSSNSETGSSNLEETSARIWSLTD